MKSSFVPTALAILFLCFDLEKCSGQQDGGRQQCPENSKYDKCGTSCPLTCDNYRDPQERCISLCAEGCICDEGFVNDTDRSICVRPEECQR